MKQELEILIYGSSKKFNFQMVIHMMLKDLNKLLNNNTTTILTALLLEGVMDILNKY